MQEEADRKCGLLRLESLHRHNDHEVGPWAGSESMASKYWSNLGKIVSMSENKDYLGG